jgi:quercetin dioxygenase-like cupin family protein
MITFGHIVFQPGERIPKQGLTSHEGDEYSFVIRGKAQCEVGGEARVASAGEAMFIPAGELHYTHNTGEEPFEVVYTLAKKTS